MTGVFKKYVIIKYFYIHWLITFLQKQSHVIYYIFGIINPSAIIVPKRRLAYL